MTTKSQLAGVVAVSGAALVAAFAFLQVLTRPLTREMPAACNSVMDLDLLLTPSKIQPTLRCLGERGRSVHLAFYAFDFVAFPLIYATFAYLALFITSRKRRPVLPVTVVLVDMIENACFIYLLTTFPAQSHAIEALVPWLLRLKWTIVAVLVVSVVAGFTARSTRAPERTVSRAATE